MDTLIQLDEILQEAESYGQRKKVMWYAKLLIDDKDVLLSELESYQSAFFKMVTREE